MRTCTVILILSWAFLGACKEGKLKLSVEKENGNTVIAIKTQANRLEGKWECTARAPVSPGPKGASFNDSFQMEFLPNLHVNHKGKVTFNVPGKSGSFSFTYERTSSFEIRKDRLCTVTTRFKSEPLDAGSRKRNNSLERDNSSGSSSCVDIVKHTKSKLVLSGEYKTTCTR